MQKIKLNIAALVRSDTHPNSYVIVLKETDGNRRLPIIIGGFEAQAIVMALEKVTTNRPLTHDLFKNTLSQFGIQLMEVIISDLSEAVFYATLICTDENGNILALDSRTSDAIALAVRFQAPIFVKASILEEAGIVLEEESETELDQTDEELQESSEENQDVGTIEDKSDDELQRMMEEALDREDYELAAKIRDELNKRKG